MDNEDKRHIHEKYGRVSIRLVALVLALAGCRSQADREAADAGVDALSGFRGEDAAVALQAPREPTVFGEWERQSEPYRGMRMALREGESKAVVTRASTVDATARNKAELECQRSLWKPGDFIASGLRGAHDALEGTVVVRDWGVTSGVCRHRDSSVAVRITLAKDPRTLLVAVTRGKTTTTQEWSRVDGAPHRDMQ